MQITVYRTSKNTEERLTQIYKGEPNQQISTNSVKLDIDVKMQKILGFGGAFTEAAAYTYSKLSTENQNKVIDAYFGQENGIGYELGRVAITSCDFSFGNYTYADDKNKNLSNFSIKHDEKWLLPMMRDAKAALGRDILLFGAPWSPPAWMKDNNDMKYGGDLLPDYYDMWAEYFIKAIEEFKKEGFPMFAVSVQNEPDAVQTWESCIYSAEQERDFVKNYLGPVFEKSNIDAKIMIWDHNRDLIFERANEILTDDDAYKYIWGTAFHWYVSEEFENVGKVHDKFPDKHLVFTEGCIEGGPRPGAWETGERYGRNIIGDLKNWNEAFIDWNLILDINGGPNHVGNLCDAPILADIENDKLIFNSSYYYIAHFSKFIKPGAKRIDNTHINGIYTVAFENTNKSVVLVAQNENDYDVDFSVHVRNKEHSVNCKAHSIMTMIFED